MKNENIKTKIGLFIFLLVLVATCFCFGKISFAEDSHPIIIRTIQTSGASPNDDFIELYNTTCKDIDLSDWKIMKKTKTGTTATSIGTLKKSIPAKGYFLWENTKDNTLGIPDYTTKTYYLSDDYSIALFDKDEKQIDSVTWGENQNPFENTLTYPSNPKKSEALRRSLDNTFSIKQNYSPNNSSFIETTEITSCQKENPPKDNDYIGELKINEILPAPKTQNSGKEFVEVVNISSEIINLFGMRIEDEKNHKVSFPEKTIAPKELFILEGNFELNNTSPDTAFLIAKDGAKENPIDSVNYEKPKYDYAYAFDGSAWQWTSKITKGAKNEFNKLLSGKIKKDKKIYTNVYANFEVDADKKAKKFTWNFGDGHKSYLKKTRHKYEKSGTYDATLKLTGDGKENLLSFTVKVEKFGKAKVQIISLSPNPAGIDSAEEWLEILNNTKKKVNLKNWSVATGWKKLANHPIKKDFILKAGESKKLTRELCAFSLGNKQAKLELRYPDGKVADKIKYDRKNDSISEDELYQKEGNAWQWILSQKDAEEKQSATELKTTENVEIKPTDTVPEVKIEEPEKADFDLSDLGKSTKNPAWQEKQKTQIVLLFAKSNINPEKFLTKNQGRVLGISTVKFSSTKITPPKSADQLWKKINAKLNEFILMF